MNKLETLYEVLKTASDPTTRDRIRDDYLRARGCTRYARRLYALYEESRNNGNEHMDFEGFVDFRDVPGMVEAMRALGTDHFTMSGSHTIFVLAAFIDAGCTVEGTTQTTHTSGLTVTGLLFKVNK